jgi:uncharacterized membrane protein
MVDQRYYVIGGEYADTSFTSPAPGTELETHGPFTERDAKVFWRSITGKTVDNAMVRYFLKPEDQVNGKIYWVVGGEYADSSFTRLAPGREIEVFGPFEKWEALGFWRGLTAKSVDDALVRYDIRKHYHRGDGEQAGTVANLKLAGGGAADTVATELAPTVTKSVALAAPAARAFAFIMDGRNWPQWAIHNVKSVKQRDDGSWELETPRGTGHLKLVGDAGTGVIDQSFTAADSGTWRVPGRVAPVPGGCVFSMVFARPQGLSDDAFKQGMRLLDEELAALKKAVEGR